MNTDLSWTFGLVYFGTKLECAVLHLRLNILRTSQKKIKNFKNPYPTCQFQIIQIILIMFSEIYSIGRNEEESCGSFLVPTLMDSNPDLENRKQSKIQFGIVVEDTEDHLIRSFSNLILIQITLLENTTGLPTKDRIYTVCYPLQITSSPLIKVNLTTMKHKV